MPYSEYLTFTLSMLIFVAIPGAGVLSCISHSIRQGYISTLPLILGILLGDILYFSLSIGGMAVLLHTYPRAEVFLKIGGAIYLGFLGIRMWLKSSGPSSQGSEIKTKWYSTFSKGMIISLSNPKVMLFYIALLPGLIKLDSVNLKSYLVLLSLLSICLILVLSIYSFLGEATSRFLKQDQHQFIDKIAGTLLLGAALLIIIK